MNTYLVMKRYRGDENPDWTDVGEFEAEGPAAAIDLATRKTKAGGNYRAIDITKILNAKTRVRREVKTEFVDTQPDLKEA